jgi:CubicO group peptidase (beta-lactamase class C family)
MNKIILLTILIITICNQQTRAQNRKYSAAIEERIEQVENNLAGWVLTGADDRWTLEERMKKYNINGLSIAVINNHQIEWARGYGFAGTGGRQQVTEKTLFQAGSVSKSLNSLGVLLLAQEKKLSLDQDINNYLSDWSFPYDSISSGKVITMIQLLSHTAGLTVSGFPGYKTGETLPAVIQILDGLPPANTSPVRSGFVPGERFSYSGGGTTILQLIITDVSGTAYDEFMKERVLDQLGMKESFFTQPPPDSKKSLLATGYLPNGTEVEGKYHIYPEQAAAGLWTTPTDLCRYIIETQLSYNGKSSLVLTPEMSRLRLTPVIDDAALGVFVNSRVTGSYKYFNHNGGNEGFCCTAIGCMNDGKGVVIMTNTHYNNTGILEEIANSVATVYRWKDYYLPEKKNVIETDRSVLAKYAGMYEADGRKIIFTLSDSVLQVSISEGPGWPVYFIGPDEFFIRESKGTLKFLSDENQLVTGFSGNDIRATKIR